MTIAQSLRLLRLEAVITSALIAMPIMNPFFESIGLDQGQIGLSQALFTVALLMFNIPTGWLADRFSRKLSNGLGDLIAGFGFLGYALAENFAHVVMAEVAIGVGLAFTQGADVGLLRAYCQRLGRAYEDEATLIATFRPLVQMLAVILGGIIGAHDPRLAIALSATPYFVGALLIFFIKEVGIHRAETAPQTAEKRSLARKLRHAFSDIRNITVYALHGHKDLAWAIIAAATAKEMTHAIIWVLTPLLLLAGVPVFVVGIGWALVLAATSAGAWLSKHFSKNWSEFALFAVPAFVSLGAMAVLSFSVTLWTVGLYGIFGLVRGWYSAVMSPVVQRHTPEDMQSTVFSISGSLSQLLYVGAVVVVNLAGNAGVQWAMVANALLFAPLVLLVAFKLRPGK